MLQYIAAEATGHETQLERILTRDLNWPCSKSSPASTPTAGTKTENEGTHCTERPPFTGSLYACHAQVCYRNSEWGVQTALSTIPSGGVIKGKHGRHEGCTDPNSRILQSHYSLIRRLYRGRVSDRLPNSTANGFHHSACQVVYQKRNARGGEREDQKLLRHRIIATCHGCSQPENEDEW